MNRFIQTSFVLFMVVNFSSCGYSVIKNKHEIVMKEWSNVESNLHRRADLIPDLIEILHILSPRSSQLISHVIESRTKSVMIQFTPNDLINTEAVEKMIKAQNDLSEAVDQLMKGVENFSNLKHNTEYIQIKNKIMDAEKGMKHFCHQYNIAVSSFNKSIKKFPYNVTNSIFFHAKEMKPISLLIFH